MAWSGKYTPKNPQKYKGDPTNIFYRSRIELRYMQYIDGHDDIIEWNSEETIVQYISPKDLKVHRYFPDLWMRIRDSDGTTRTLMVELKHSSDLREPKPPAKPQGRRRFIGEMITWDINHAKWAAAENYCKDRGWTFMVLSEKQLGKAY